MKLKIGENIKTLRKSKEIRQEALAEMLGVSCQSVSRWESGVCYPDMELLPVIAKLFDSSVDSLLGVDEITEKENIDRYLERFQFAISKGEINECISIAREGVKEYPNNYILLNKLMFALFASGDNSGNIPDWKKNMEKYDSEITSLGERIMNYCPDINLKLEATARLAFNHVLHGRKQIGRKIYETLPTMEQSRERQILWALEDDEILPFLRSSIKQSYEFLKSFIWSLADENVVDNKTELMAIKKIFELEEIILDGNRPKNAWGDVWLNFDIAKRYALLDDHDNMYKHLRFAVACADNFDSRPDEQKYSSILCGEITERKLDFETSDTRSLSEILRNKWLLHDEFDSVRDSDEFKFIIESLN